MTKEDRDDLMQSIIDESFFEDFKSKDVKDQIFTMIRYADVMDELYKSFK